MALIKIRIPAQTVEVNRDGWALEYGIDTSDVRADVKAYFASYAQEIIAGLGLDTDDTPIEGE